jgi:hypothetical protein
MIFYSEGMSMNTLSEKAMLVDLNIGQWNARKYDFAATEQVIKHYNAKWNSGKFNKLLVDLWSVKKFQRAANDARTFHYAHTLPWDDVGHRILSSEEYLGYMKKMRSFKEAFESAVVDFLEEYPALIERAKVDLGKLFNPHDYPHVSAIRGKFTFQVSIAPLPDAQDFRVDLGADEVKSIQDDIAQRVNAQVQAAVNDLWSRLHGAIKHLVEKLRDSDAIFRDSLVGNISELTDVLPRLNITGNKDLSRMIEEARNTLSNLEPDKLRTDGKSRQEAADKAEEILKKMAGYIGGNP